jgi:hypothetical protein
VCGRATIVVAADPVAAADAVLVAHHLPNLGAHLVTALARLHVISVKVWHGHQEIISPAQTTRLRGA